MKSVSALRQSPLRLSLFSHGSTACPRRSFTNSPRKQTVYGFIGLGRMGYPMASNLRARLPASDTLLVNDYIPEVADKFVSEIRSSESDIAEGAKKVEAFRTPKEVAQKSDVLITCLPDPKAVQAVFGSILPGQLPPAPSSTERLFIDCSTIDPLTSRTVAEAVHSTQAGRFVDAPMSGGVVGARAATLTFMLGASPKCDGLVERVQPILGHMGKRVMHLGGQGAGLAGKLANNYLLAISNIATAEAMNLGVRLGLDPKVLGELINSSSGRCWSSEVNNPVPGVVPGAPAERGYEGGFGVALMNKDLKLAVAAAEKASSKLELAAEASRIYDAVCDAEPGKDFSVVYKWLNRDSSSSSTNGKTEN